MTKPTTVPIKAEVNAELIQLKAELLAAGMSTPKNEDVIAGLILAARRSPVEAVKAVIETHIAAEGRMALADGDPHDA
jgi:hypothetical protein